MNLPLRSTILLSILVFLIGSTVCWAGDPGLKDLLEQKDSRGQWVYPAARADLTIIKDKTAADLFYMEQRAIMAEAESDSMWIDLAVCKGKNDKMWLDNLEFGILAGTAIAILAGWAFGQAAK